MKSAVITAILILPFLTLSAFGSESNPQGSEPHVSPTVTVLKNQRMLVVLSKGDPEKTGDAALKSLYREFFRNATEAEKNAPISPRVRWTVSAPDIRKKDWIGKYALPVSAEFPSPAAGAVVIEEWRYGLTAELLHVGGPASKAAAIESLKGYIARNGFVIAGDLEEEFLQGKATFFQGRPDNDRTLLRFPILGIQDFPIATIPLSSAPRAVPE